MQKLNIPTGEICLTGSQAGERVYTAAEIEAIKQRREQKMLSEIMRARTDHSKRIIANSGLKDAIKTLRFDNFTAESDWQRNMKAVAVHYAQNPDDWMLLSGQSGCGKTHLCTAVAGTLLDRNIPVRYMRWRIDSGKLKANYAEPEQVYAELSKYINTPCLYLDDLFKGKITDSDIKLAFALIDGRYSANRKTIISTERTPEELLDIDEATGGRILEKCREHMFTVRKDRSKNYRLTR